MQVTIDSVPYAPVCYSVESIGIAITTHNRADAYGGAVVYPCYSLVDHADGEPVECHPDCAPRTERRRAWRLA